MMSIFRLRPSNNKTIDELSRGYIWFSRPSEYKDVKDANIVGFAEANENIKESFNRIFSDYLEFGKEMNYSGICCFTESLPMLDDWKHFPKGSKGIFIEYDKEKIEQYFLQNYGIGDCFKKVEYMHNSLIVKSSSDYGYDILWETSEDGFLYKSIKGDIERNSKDMNDFLLKLFTRLSDNFKIQKELRIILGGRNIPNRAPNIKGYKVPIPLNAILRIYVQSNTPKHYINELKTAIPADIEIITVK